MPRPGLTPDVPADGRVVLEPYLADQHQPPTPAAPAACQNCHGHHWGYGTVTGGRIDRVTCWVCGGSAVESPAVAA